MSRPPRSRFFRLALQLAGAQVGIGLLAGAVWWIASGGADALAAVAGGCTPALLNLHMALRLPVGDTIEPRAFLAAFYRAQAMKFGLAVGLLALAAVVFADQFPALITTLALALVMHWFALLWAR